MLRRMHRLLQTISRAILPARIIKVSPGQSLNDTINNTEPGWRGVTLYLLPGEHDIGEPLQMRTNTAVQGLCGR